MFKFTIDPVQVRATEDRITKLFQSAINDRALMADVGKITTERIRYQARVTKPLNEGASFPALAPKSVSHRRYLSKYNAVDPTFKATRSNLTITGAFLNSLGFMITGVGEVTLQFFGQHPGYKTAKGGPRPGPQMSELFGYLKDKGFFAFTGLGLQEFQPLRKRLNATVSAYLRRSLKT